MNLLPGVPSTGHRCGLGGGLGQLSARLAEVGRMHSRARVQRSGHRVLSLSRGNAGQRVTRSWDGDGTVYA